MDPRAQDPADFEPCGESGDLLPELVHAPLDWTPRAIPWEEAVEWTFAPMTFPTEGAP